MKRIEKCLHSFCTLINSVLILVSALYRVNACLDNIQLSKGFQKLVRHSTSLSRSKSLEHSWLQHCRFCYQFLFCQFSSTRKLAFSLTPTIPCDFKLFKNLLKSANQKKNKSNICSSHFKRYLPTV